MTNSSALVPQMTGDAYLRFKIGQVSALLSMKYVQETLILPSRRLTPMPNVSPCMVGLTNRRNRVMWVIDLAQLLGLSALDASSDQYMLILMQVNSVSLGLAVHQVEGTARLEADSIQSPVGQVANSLLPYLQGYVLQQQKTQEILLVLDGEAIAHSPVFRDPVFV